MSDSDFEVVGSIARRLLLDIALSLPPSQRAEALETLGECDIQFAPEIKTAAAGGRR